MQLLSPSQIKTVDVLTIERQQISSIDLMERVAVLCAGFISQLLSPGDKEVLVFCGKGNNGGDGLAIARLLENRKYKVKVVVVHHTQKFSKDAQINFERLSKNLKDDLINIVTAKDIGQLQLSEYTIIIDALLGTGVNKPMTGILKSVAEFINPKPCKVISIDVPSGLMTDSSSKAFLDSCIRADLVLSLHLPKLAYLMPENKNIVPRFEIIDIGLNETAIREQSSNFHYLQDKDIQTLLKPRNKFSHKGTYGHALLFSGSSGKAGAAIIAAEACLRSGAGLLTVHSIGKVAEALSIRLPEAMTSIDKHSSVITNSIDLSQYNALAFGPGTGSGNETQLVLKTIIDHYQGKLIIDADGINILAANKDWLEHLPPDTILTPHPKEFERLTGSFKNDFDRLQQARSFAINHRCILVLKDTYTHICTPDGQVAFNSTGNAGLAKGGSGDGLTGIILGLSARGYAPKDAATTGTYLHGLAADICAQEQSMESILITDVIAKLPEAFKRLENF